MARAKKKATAKKAKPAKKTAKKPAKKAAKKPTKKAAKQPAKQPKQSKQSKQSKPSVQQTFAFFGQGDAAYFEWFEMWIWFRDPVPEPIRANLLAIAPKLCALDAQWPNPHLLWASTGDQWIHQHLINEYGSKAAQATLKRILKHQEETGDPWDTGDEDEDGMFAGSKELAQFNADIEAWLIAMHSLQPILFAARREDGEAGGTRLGAWHKRSVAAFQTTVRPAIELISVSTKTDDDHRVAPLTIAIHYGGEVSPALAAWVQRDS